MKKMNEMRFAARAFGRGVRVMAALDIGRCREEAQSLRASLERDRAALAEHRLNGTGTEAELTGLRDRIAADAQRYSDLMGALRSEEERQAAGVAAQFNRRQHGIADAMGAYFRAAMTGTALDAAVRAELSVPVTIGANPGNNLLPITVSNELITDLFEDGGLLSAITVTQIKGLRLPKISTNVTVTDAALADGATATEHTMDDDMITFGRFPARDVIAVPDSVLRGTNTDLSGYISRKLHEIHRERLYRRLLAASATGNYAHMSVYNSEVGIASVSGTTAYEAITKALAALPIAARRVAKVVMTPAAYYGMIRDLTNGAATLFGGAAQQILGFEVVLCEGVTGFIVGDLKTIHVNYDDVLGMDVDKVVRTGVVDTVLHGDYDIQIEEPTRLRLATVAA